MSLLQHEHSHRQVNDFAAIARWFTAQTVEAAFESLGGRGASAPTRRATPSSKSQQETGRKRGSDRLPGVLFDPSSPVDGLASLVADLFDTLRDLSTRISYRRSELGESLFGGQLGSSLGEGAFVVSGDEFSVVSVVSGGHDSLSMRGSVMSRRRRRWSWRASRWSWAR